LFSEKEVQMQHELTGFLTNICHVL